MHAIDYLREPFKGSAKPIYAVYGDDAFLRREALSTLVRRALKGEDDELAVVRFQGEQAKLADVVDEVRTLPFFSKRKIVIVESADPFVTTHRKDLEGYAEKPSSAGILVLSVKLWASTTKLAKLVEREGLAIECKGPNERALTGWLIQFAKTRFDAHLDEDAARLLVELVGVEIGLLVAEIEKLAVYVGKSSKIHSDDVARMVGAGRIETIWKTLDAATSGRGDLALEYLDGLLSSGEHPVGLLAAMSVSLLRVHHAGSLRRGRMKPADACVAAGIKSFFVEKTLQQHAHLGPSRVDRLPQMLLRADLDLKGASTLAPRAVLEALLVQLSRPRQD